MPIFFLIDRSGIMQTPSSFYGEIFQKLPLPIPAYSPHTKAYLFTDVNHQEVILGYSFISTKAASSPFILMVVKKKSGMMAIWRQLRHQYKSPGRSGHWGHYFSDLAGLYLWSEQTLHGGTRQKQKPCC